jgi:hypothetical protein
MPEMKTPKAAHLEPELDEDGRAAMPPLIAEHGGSVQVRESLRRDTPLILIEVEDPVEYLMAALLPDQAWRLADQLRALVRNHFLGDQTPKWADPNA